MHRSERNLDVRVGIMPTIHPIYRRNNLENNLPNNKINPENNRLFLKNKPTIAITKTKARATAKTIAKAITKENLSSCQADKPPRERSFLFLDRMILVKRRASVQEALRYLGYIPSASHSLSSSPRGGAEGASRRACTLIWVRAEIRGYGRMLSAPTSAHLLKLYYWIKMFKLGSGFIRTKLPIHSLLGCVSSGMPCGQTFIEVINGRNAHIQQALSTERG